MKSTRFARKLVGIASLLGVSAGLVACGAESGDPSGIGQSSQALHGNAPVVGSLAANALGANQGADHFAQCTVKDSVTNTLYLVMAGGHTSLGTVTDRILFRTPAGSWAQAQSGGVDVKLSVARSHSAVIQSADLTKCIVLGGEDLSGNAKTAIETITVANGAWSKATSNLASARSRAKAEACASGIILFGGFDNAASPKVLNSIEASDGFPGTFTTATNTLVTRREEYALAKNIGDNRLVVAGGYDGTNPLDTIEVITNTVTSNRCVPTSTRLNVSTKVLSNPVFGNVAFPTGNSNEIAIMAGSDGSAEPVDIDLVTLNTTPANSTVAVDSETLDEGVYEPALVRVPDSGNPDAFMLIGGAKVVTAPQTFTTSTTLGTLAQQYQSGFSLLSDTLNTPRYAGPQAASLLSGTVYAPSGIDDFSPSTTWALSMEPIAP